jgi:acetyltransferase-like isoleucine patch superfamily enzyme
MSLSFLFRLVRRGYRRGKSDVSRAEQDEEIIRRLRKLGVQIGDDCRVYAVEFSTEPYLVRLGNGVCVSGGVKFLTHDGAARLLKSRRPMIQSFGRINVGDNCFIGENALLLPGTTIGRDCVIGAGAVVRGTVPENSLVIGNPGQVVGRASLFLLRLERSANTLDTFGLDESARRRVIMDHFSLSDGISA